MTKYSPAVEMVWRCPKCRRIYREHVFEACTAMSGPTCNTCALPLVWAAVEAGRAVIGKREWLRMEAGEDARAESLEDE
jgi:hypothetical protein